MVTAKRKRHIHTAGKNKTGATRTKRIHLASAQEHHPSRYMRSPWRCLERDVWIITLYLHTYELRYHNWTEHEKPRAVKKKKGKRTITKKRDMRALPNSRESAHDQFQLRPRAYVHITVKLSTPHPFDDIVNWRSRRSENGCAFFRNIN